MAFWNDIVLLSWSVISDLLAWSLEIFYITFQLLLFIFKILCTEMLFC